MKACEVNFLNSSTIKLCNITYICTNMFLDDSSESEEEEGHEEEEGLEQDKEARHFRSTLSCNLNDPAVFQRHMKAVLELEGRHLE